MLLPPFLKMIILILICFMKKLSMTFLIALSNGKYDAYIGVEDNTSFHIAENNLSNLIIGSKAPYKYRPIIATRNNDKILEGIIEKKIFKTLLNLGVIP